MAVTIRMIACAVALAAACLGPAQAQQHDRAIQDFDQAIKLNPNYAIAFYNRGNAYKQALKEGADTDLAAARRIDPNIGR